MSNGRSGFCKLGIEDATPDHSAFGHGGEFPIYCF